MSKEMMSSKKCYGAYEKDGINLPLMQLDGDGNWQATENYFWE